MLYDYGFNVRPCATKTVRCPLACMKRIVSSFIMIFLIHSFIFLSAHRASEGKTVEVDYRGNVDDTMLDVLGGLRSACTYVGAGKIKEMPKRTTFIR